MDKNRFDALYKQEPAAAVAAMVREGFPVLLASATNNTLTSKERSRPVDDDSPPKSFTVELSNGARFHIQIAMRVRQEKEADSPK